MNNKLKSIILLCVLLIASDFSFGQNQPADNSTITCGNYRMIYSKILGEERTLLVSLPDNYDKSDKKYHVIYKLDGFKGNFLQAYSAAFYLYDMTENTPDAIIVGIENTDRNRDMGPDHKADNFIQFLKDELIPFIDKNYRTNSLRILCGQSYSTLFALYAFLKQPALFDAYILGSFGLYNDDLASLLESEMKKNNDLKTIGKKCIFIANGKRDTYDPDGSITKRGESFLESLKQVVPASVLFKVKTYEEEGHVPFPALYDGLKWIYSCNRQAEK
jgi:uncharacterized protein